MLKPKQIKLVFRPYFSQNKFILVMHQNLEITCITLDRVTFLQNIDLINSKIQSRFEGDRNTIINHIYLSQYVHSTYWIRMTGSRLLIANPANNSVVKIDIPRYQKDHSEFQKQLLDNINDGMHILNDILIYTCNRLFGITHIPISKTQYRKLQQIDNKRCLKNMDLHSSPVDTQLIDILHNLTTKLGEYEIIKFKASEVECKLSHVGIDIRVGPYKLGSVLGTQYITTIGELDNFKSQLSQYILKYV